MIKELILMANHLDRKGLIKESTFLDKAIEKLSMAGDYGDDWGYTGEGAKPSHEELEPEFNIDRDAKEVAEMIISSVIFQKEDAELEAENLAIILSEPKHASTVKDIIEFIDRLSSNA